MLALSPAAKDLRRQGWRRLRRTPPTWAVRLATIPFLAALYLLLPLDGPTRVIAYPAFGIIGTVTILLAIHRRHPARLASWRLLAAAFTLLSLGDVTYTILALSGEVPYPSWPTSAISLATSA